MSTTTNGNAGRYPTRRLRFDASTVRHVGSGRYPMTPERSGRRFILVALLSVSIVWGALYIFFRDWRARVWERTNFGRLHVATTVDPLAKLTPPDVDPSEWRAAVAETHAMLRTVTGSNLLDLADMRKLRAELKARTARTRPETARAELTAIWDDMEARAGHTLDRHARERPKVLRKAAPQEAEK